MTKKQVEKMILDAADALVPEVPPFESFEKNVDCNEVARKAGRDRRVNKKIILLATAASFILVIAIAIPISGLFTGSPSSISPSQIEVTVGDYAAETYHASDPTLDLSVCSLRVRVEESSGMGIAKLVEQDGTFACTVAFSGTLFGFASFLQPLARTGNASYAGTFLYEGERFPLQLGLSDPNAKSITINAMFGDDTTSVNGHVFFRLQK